jgi:DNA-binding NarL/FixJ family response regulator
MSELDCSGTASEHLSAPPQTILDSWQAPKIVTNIGWIDVACLTRDCVVRAVGAEERLFAITAFNSVEECVAYTQSAPDIIVYHSHDMNSVNLKDIAALRQTFSNVRIVVLSDAAAMKPSQIKEVLKGGASGFILTEASGLQNVVSALNLVACGGTVIPTELFLNDNEPQPTVQRGAGKRAGRLTQRETEVLALMQTGCSNKTIAETLNMSPATTKVHVRKLMQKLGATNRTQVAMNACKLTVEEAVTGRRAV